jgi:reductive dehalogenase
MSEKAMDRRHFLTALGTGSAAVGLGTPGLAGISVTLGGLLSVPRVVGATERGVLVESEAEYGGFLVEKLLRGGLPYEVDPAVLRPMREVDNVFSRNGWDPIRLNRPEREEDITHRNLVEGEGKIPNQNRLDYALMAAAWRHASMGGSRDYDWDGVGGQVRGAGLDQMGPWDPADMDMSWEEATVAVRHAALFLGASLAGVAEMNPLWLYRDIHSPTREDRARSIPVHRTEDRFERTSEAWYIPESMNRVVALAFEEDFHGISNSPGRLASAATGNGYSRMAVTAGQVADFIRGLGYRALPAGNGVGLSIPIAIDAGLGQLGRMGLLVTPKYGPRVRLAKVITDMPLVPDSPIDFGVTEFCEVCMLCAEDCPSESVTKGSRTWEGTSVSNNPGALKWYTKPEGCYDFNGFSCSNCKRVCPFNKPNNSWLHRMIRGMIEGRSLPADRVMVKLDQASGYGEQTQDTQFWQMEGPVSITAREKM